MVVDSTQGGRDGTAFAALGLRWVVPAVACALLAGPAFAGGIQEQLARMPGPLSKAHAAVSGAGQCAKCHVEPGKIAASLCLTCHKPIAERVAAKKGVHRDVGNECSGCHAEHQGVDVDLRPIDPASFDHAADAGFRLTGAHEKVAATCAACHKTRSYLGNRPDCVSCHTDGHQGALGTDCASCHSPETGWSNASRAFHKSGAFPLAGKHLQVRCTACHQNGVVKGTPTTCYDCHWARRKDDRYQTRLGSQCENCHTPLGWTAVKWNHGSITGVALNPQHRLLGCDSCHEKLEFRPGSVQCATCHRGDYDRTQAPSHAAAGFPLQCQLCHVAASSTFRGARFVHAASYPLVGPHATQPCVACHAGNAYRGTPNDCYSCHRDDYQRAASPNHSAAGFPTQCEVCHRPSDPSFKGGTFNHAATYQLVGVHATQSCTACHRSGVYRGTPRECVACHQTDYDRTTSPNHAAAGFPTQCEVCHRQSDLSFKGGTFSHNTSYALLGVHATQPCSACHKNNVYRGTPRECYPCHQADYQRTTSPNHVSAGFPTACEQCHRPSDPSFKGAGFNHNSVFSLVGVHATQPCTACHRNNVYRGTPRDCYGCHRTDYERTTVPNHALAGFPTTCEACHRATDPSFRGASFNHASVYALVGVHATQPCTACHRNNVYRGTPRDCVGCHLADYQAARNPNHVAAGFPTTCTSCHRQTDASWSQAVFNHTWFPISSGRHAGQACSACHTDASNFRVFTCFTCHDRARTDSIHSGRPGYRYDSNACYSCHPQGRG